MLFHIHRSLTYYGRAGAVWEKKTTDKTLTCISPGRNVLPLYLTSAGLLDTTCAPLPFMMKQRLKRLLTGCFCEKGSRNNRDYIRTGGIRSLGGRFCAVSMRSLQFTTRPQIIRRIETGYAFLGVATRTMREGCVPVFGRIRLTCCLDNCAIPLRHYREPFIT